MGRVLSFFDVVNGRLPSEAGFAAVEQKLAELLASDGNHQLTALIFGSAGYQKPSVRSDFDYLLVYPQVQQDRAQRRARELRAYARDGFVVTDPYLVSREHLRSGHHTIGESFLNHLQLMEDAGRTIGRPVVGLIHAPQPAGAEFIDYLTHKNEWLNDWLTQGWESEADRLRGLQKILEMPVHIIRRCLAATGQFIDEKSLAIEAYQKHVNHRSSQIFEALQDNDSGYSALLQRSLAKAKDYEKELVRIGESARVLQDWLQRHLS